MRESTVFLPCLLDQSVDTGIKQLWTNVELCNKWQHQLPRQPKCLLPECFLTGQTPTWYLQYTISITHSKQKLPLRWEACYILCKTRSVLIIIPVFIAIQLRHHMLLVAKCLPLTYGWKLWPIHAAVCKRLPKTTRHHFPRWATHLLSFFLFFLPLFISDDKCQLWTGDLWDRKDKAQFTNHFLSKQTGAMTEPACCNWISCCYLLTHKKMSTSRILAVQKVLIHYDFECGDDNVAGVLSLDSEWNILK